MRQILDLGCVSSNLTGRTFNVVIAQLVERQSSKLDVGSSILLYHFLCGSSSAGSSDRLKICMSMVRVLSGAFKVLWWNWNTRQVKVLVPKGLRVRVSSELNTYKWRNWDTLLPQKQLSFGNMGSSPILYITGK